MNALAIKLCTASRGRSGLHTQSSDNDGLHTGCGGNVGLHTRCAGMRGDARRCEGQRGRRGDGRVWHSAPNSSNIIMTTHTDTFWRAVRPSTARCANRQSTAVTQHSAPASSSPSWPLMLLPSGAQYRRVRPGAPTGTLRAAVRSADTPTDGR